MRETADACAEASAIEFLVYWLRHARLAIRQGARVASVTRWPTRLETRGTRANVFLDVGPHLRWRAQSSHGGVHVAGVPREILHGPVWHPVEAAALPCEMPRLFRLVRCPTTKMLVSGVFRLVCTRNAVVACSSFLYTVDSLEEAGGAGGALGRYTMCSTRRHGLDRQTTAGQTVGEPATLERP